MTDMTDKTRKTLLRTCAGTYAGRFFIKHLSYPSSVINNILTSILKKGLIYITEVSFTLTKPSTSNEDKILYKKRTRNALLPRLRPTRSESKNVELDTPLHRTAKTNRSMPLQQVCQVLHCQGGGAHLGILRHTRRHMTRKTGAPI